MDRKYRFGADRSRSPVNRNRSNSNSSFAVELSLRLLLDTDACLLIRPQMKRLKSAHQSLQISIIGGDGCFDSILNIMGHDEKRIFQSFSDVLATFFKNFTNNRGSIRILIPKFHIGAIIGFKGQTMKKLQQRYKIFIRISDESLSNSDEQVVTFNGKEKAVSNCVQSMSNLLFLPKSSSIVYHMPELYNGPSRTDENGGILVANCSNGDLIVEKTLMSISPLSSLEANEAYEDISDASSLPSSPKTHAYFDK